MNNMTGSFQYNLNSTQICNNIYTDHCNYKYWNIVKRMVQGCDWIVTVQIVSWNVLDTQKCSLFYCVTEYSGGKMIIWTVELPYAKQNM